MGPGFEIVVEESLRRPLYPPKLNRGDLIVARSPIDPRAVVCKRLIGIGGDVICVDPSGKMEPASTHVVIPEGYVWVTGDNLPMSRDSRTYGPLPLGAVRGKIFARVRD